ncbi:hypothetical protein A4X06_0g5675 [Tilletia controversa]|uniref:Uncharacterized protein n=2 Tax=Tilletia TaxID=13289 RepID=A0A8X7MRL5_9BASI|nr:hypothetical protein CF335_g4874 [Tilletia laevis]KAE8245464.1 hypothetical protein A4X06_0g5675 [Tilletia controversa]
MVRLLTLTTIFLSSLAAFTMADTNADLAAPPKPDDLFTLVKSAQAVYRGFIALYDVFDQPKEGIKTAAFYHTAYKAVMTIDQHFNRSQMASELTKDPDFIHFGNYADLGALRNVYNRTYGVDGNAQKACQKLSEAAPELKAFEKDDQARADADRIVKPGARIADAIEMLMQDHALTPDVLAKYQGVVSLDRAPDIPRSVWRSNSLLQTALRRP